MGGSINQALGKPVYTLITSLGRSIIFLLPAAYLLSLTGVLSNVWYSFLIGEVASIVLCVFFLRRAYRDVGLV